jgi:hypothetical protein
MRPPRDPPFYPGSWLVGFLILAIGLNDYRGWVAIGAFVGFLALHAVVVEIWLSRAATKRPAGHVT